MIEGVATITLEPPTTGHIDSAGDVEATFVFTCSMPMNMEVGMDLTQGTGASLVRGGELITVDCFAPSTSVTLTAKGTRDDGVTNAPFRPGPAEWRYDWNAITRVQLFPTQTVFGTLQLDGARVRRGAEDHPAAHRRRTDPIRWTGRWPGDIRDRRALPGRDRPHVGRGVAAPQAAQVPARMTRVTWRSSSSSTRSAR